jgi:excisionase family DNA binding protein
MNDDELLLPSQVARIFHVNPKTVTRWARAGKINSIRTLGGHRRFYRSEVERVVAAAIGAGEHDDVRSSLSR